MLIMAYLGVDAAVSVRGFIFIFVADIDVGSQVVVVVVDVGSQVVSRCEGFFCCTSGVFKVFQLFLEHTLSFPFSRSLFLLKSLIFGTGMWIQKLERGPI